MFNFENKVALVTGGNSGIGKASVMQFAEAGAKVGVLGRSRDEVNATVEEVKEKTSNEVIALIADISKATQMEKAYQKLIAKWGRLDIVFANAGINGVWASLEDLTPDEWDTTIDVNLKGTFLTVKYAVPYLKQRGGSIIVTSSVNGTRMFSNTGATAYACSKAGQVAFVKMTAIELAHYGIRINVICPGAIETNIEENTERENLEEIQEKVEFPEGNIPLTDGKPGSSKQVADLVSFLASDLSSHITGTEVWIDGAQSLLQG